MFCNSGILESLGGCGDTYKALECTASDIKMLTPKTRDQLSKAAGFIRESTSRGLGDGDLLRSPPVPSLTHTLARKEDSTAASREHPDRTCRVRVYVRP